MNRYVAIASAFALLAAAASACTTMTPANDAPARASDPRAVSDTMKDQASSSSLVSGLAQQNKGR